MVSLCCCFHNDDPGGNVNSSHRGFMYTLFNKVYLLVNQTVQLGLLYSHVISNHANF
jgi:hypothetical protein